MFELTKEELDIIYNMGFLAGKSVRISEFAEMVEKDKRYSNLYHGELFRNNYETGGDEVRRFIDTILPEEVRKEYFSALEELRKQVLEEEDEE